MATFKDLLKKWFYQQGTQAATSTSRIPILDANGNPTGCDTVTKISSILGSYIFKGTRSNVSLDTLLDEGAYYCNLPTGLQQGMYDYGVLLTRKDGNNRELISQFYYDTYGGAFWRMSVDSGSTWRFPWRRLDNANDNAFLGIAYGTCSTTGTTTAKTVTISNFILLTNSMVSIQFTNAVPAGATLNVSSTGAKPIWYHGAAIQDGEILAGTQAVLQYDGTRWNVVSKEEGRKGGYGQDWVDMGLPSGVLWAKKNIDITQPNHFAASEYQYECSFASWGNTFMHNPSSSSAFAYNWGGANESEPYYQNQPYGSTPGNSIQTNLSRGNDVARVQLGAPWRLPSSAEFKELFDNSTLVDENGAAVTTSTPSVDSNARGENDKRVKVNNIVGLRLKSNINGNVVFFPASGIGNGSSWNSRGASGYLWSSSFSSARIAQGLSFRAGGVYQQDASYRYYGFSIRPVM